jgi:hypothetical protein
MVLWRYWRIKESGHQMTQLQSFVAAERHHMPDEKLVKIEAARSKFQSYCSQGAG